MLIFFFLGGGGGGGRHFMIYSAENIFNLSLYQTITSLTLSV